MTKFKKLAVFGFVIVVGTCLTVVTPSAPRYTIAYLLDHASKRLPAATTITLADLKLPLGFTVADLPYVGLWSEYFAAMGVTGNMASGNVGTSFGNVSLIQFNQQRFHQNPCFQKLAGYFYDEIERQDLTTYAREGLSQRKLRRRASLADVAGSGKFASIKSGWLWELALKYSGNSKTLALQLIGVCGHDDVISERMTFPPLQPEAERCRAQTQERLNWDLCDKSDNECYQMFQSYKNRGCPARYSLMYLPASLGTDVDIADSLKAEIAKIQAPAKGAEVLPAKAYHVLTSAFSSCLALERCTDEMACPYVFYVGSKTAINIYRAKALCDGLISGSPVIRSEILLRKYPLPLVKRACSSFTNVTKLESVIQSFSERDCGDYSTEKCQQELAKLKTFAIDFEWSRAQNKVGFDFAVKNCPRLAKDADPLAESCSVLQNLESNKLFL